VAALGAEPGWAVREVERATEHVLITTISLMLRYPGDGADAAAAEALRTCADSSGFNRRSGSSTDEGARS
jgi:hypothetical protein